MPERNDNPSQADTAGRNEAARRKRQYMLLRLKKAARAIGSDITPPFLVKLFVPRHKRKGRPEKLMLTPEGKPFIVGENGPGEFAFIPGTPLITVPIRQMRYAGGLHFTPQENHFVRYLRDGISALEEFYERHQPVDILEKHFLPSAARPGAPLKGLPWILYNNGDFDRKVPSEKGLSASHGHQHHGPVSPEKIALEASHLDRLRSSFEKHGYKESNEPPAGHFIVDDNGDWAFYVKDGQHRIAVMAHLGYETANVTLTSGTVRAVNASSAGDWPMVTRSLVTRDEALSILRAYTAPDRNLKIFSD